MVTKFRVWSIFLFMLVTTSVFAQKFLFDSATIELRPLNINTKKESEFSPFKIGNSFYYTSSQERKVGVTHMEKATEHQMLDIYKGYLSDSVTIKDVKALTRKINNSVNQGSCFFDIENSRLYYSGDVPAQSHYKKYKLAIFSSEFKNNEFQYPKIEIVLADTFSAAHPMLYKGKLYFSANLAGGKGKTDIYYAEKIDNQWANIKNCAYLNTSECEYFPYAINDDEIYFSSNRLGGYGKLDIYKSTRIDSSYQIQNLGAPVNSRADDFGIYMDTLQEGGYFSSDRKNGQDDIYYFKQTWPVFKNCKDPVVEDYCYNLTEESTLDSDSLKGYYYQWSFGDGTTQKGLTVRHCFPGPASYLINLNIIDSVTRAVFMSQASFDLKVDSIVQLKVNCPDTIVQNKKITINTDWTYLPDNKITGYYFEIDGKRMRGPSHEMAFAEKGIHHVLLGVTTLNNKTKQKELLCSAKNIVVVDSATWLAVEKRQIEKIAEQFAYKKFPGDSSLLSNMNYDEEEMKYNKKGINGALAAAEIKKIVDQKIADRKNQVEGVAANKSNDSINNNLTQNPNNVTLSATGNTDPSGQKYLNPIMDTLMDIKEDEDVTFKVHLGTSKTVKDTTLLNAKGITGIEEKKIGDEYHYTYGNEKKIKDIEKYYDKTIKAGIEDAVVVGYKGDSISGVQKKSIKEVDFDKKKTKEDSLRIAKNIQGKNALQNYFDNLNALQLRSKAKALLTNADEKDLKIQELKTSAETRSGAEKDSLLTLADNLQTKSQNQKLEAVSLNQKANALDYKNNNDEIKELLTRIKKEKPTAANNLIAKNAEISALKTEVEKLRTQANALTNPIDKIAALAVVTEKETEILKKQDDLISELKAQTTALLANADPKNNSTNKNGTNTNSNTSLANNTKNNSTNKNDTKGTLATNNITNTSNTTKNGNDPANKNTGTNDPNNVANTKNNTDLNLKDNSTSANNSLTTNTTKDLDEYGFIPTTDIQKTNMEFLEDFGDLEVEDVEFKVQVGVFKKRSTYHFPRLRGLGKVSNEHLRDGSTRMTMGGSYKTLRQAIRHNRNIVKAGQSDAFVSVYYKGKRIGIENLKRKGVLVKTQVVTDSVSLTKLTINSSNLIEYAQIDKTEEPENKQSEEKIIAEETFTTSFTTTEATSTDEFVFVPRTNIQKKTVFYAEKYGNISADGLEFKVQIAIFKYRNSYSFPKLKDLGKIETESAEEGGTRMTIGGSFKTLNEAFEFNKKVVKAGQTDSFVAVYYSGKRIYMENLEKKGIFTSNIKVNKAD